MVPINTNALNIAFNSEAIADLRHGLAAATSIPDTGGFAADETWALSGGFANYGDNGGSERGFGGAFSYRPSTSSRWSMGIAGAVSGGSHAVRIQGRIGG